MPVMTGPWFSIRSGSVRNSVLPEDREHSQPDIDAPQLRNGRGPSDTQSKEVENSRAASLGWLRSVRRHGTERPRIVSGAGWVVLIG